jgi:hypothetical protein
MTSGDEESGAPPADVRRGWLEHELGDDWVAQGDGTYRFVGVSRDAPIARDDSHEGGERPAPAAATDEPAGREPRHSRLPWRRQ